MRWGKAPAPFGTAASVKPPWPASLAHPDRVIYGKLASKVGECPIVRSSAHRMYRIGVCVRPFSAYANRSQPAGWPGRYSALSVRLRARVL